MRRLCFAVVTALVFLGTLMIGSSAEKVSVRGDYLEVRTASVFAGACHFNGEVTTTGRDAMMAWRVSSGKWNGVDLAGVRVVAIVTADANLSENDGAHRSEIIVDRDASDAQAAAFIDALKTKYASSLGSVVAVVRAPIRYAQVGRTYRVEAGDLVSINVEPMPDDLCCKMPNLVWYSPLVPLENRKVGYTTKARYAGDNLADSWERSGENSAFYGRFAF